MADLFEQVQRIEQEVKETKLRLDNQERGLGKKFVESLNERLNTFNGEVTSSGPTKSVSEGGSSSYDVAKKYDKTVEVSIDGSDYKIGLYNA